MTWNWICICQEIKICKEIKSKISQTAKYHVCKITKSQIIRETVIIYEKSDRWKWLTIKKKKGKGTFFFDIFYLSCKFLFFKFTKKSLKISVKGCFKNATTSINNAGCLNADSSNLYIGVCYLQQLVAQIVFNITFKSEIWLLLTMEVNALTAS